MKTKAKYFSNSELVLWLGSISVIVISFFAFGNSDYLSLIASLIGVSSLIFVAKGNPIGQILAIIFSLLYGIISFSSAYYGEMITYLGMTMPMAVFSLISWLKNPYNGKKTEVKVNKLNPKEYIFMAVLSLVVTVIFYFILSFLNTANLIPSTISVATSFVAVNLTFRRSPGNAVGYAANDLVLIVLWILATLEDFSYISVVICFMAFFINDIYGFISWKRMEKRQQQPA